MEPNYTIADRATLAFSAALMLLGIVVLGAVETLAGKPYGAVPLTNDAGEIVATPYVDPNLRVGLVVVGLLVLFAWGVYRMAGTETREAVRRELDVGAD